MIWINSKKRAKKEENIYKNTWYDWYNWLINYIPELLKIPWAGSKTKL